VEQFKMLWELQELEQEIAQKEEELQGLDSVSEYKRKKKDVAAFQEQVKLKKDELSSDKKEIRRRELELQQITAELNKLREKLYSGEIRSAKELESLEKKVNSLNHDKTALEDRILLLMEKVEGDEAVIEGLEKEEQEETAALQQLKARAQQDLHRLQKEIEQLKMEIEELLAKIDAGLLEKYRQLSRYTQGRCISLVKKGFCGICNVSLPSSFRALLLTPGKLVYCESCGSLLVAGD